MATSLYLCRKNGRFFRYDDVQAVSLTGAIETYSGVSGVASTNVVTISGATLSNGLQLVFSIATPVVGCNIVAGRTYFARDCSGATCKLEEYVGAGVFSLGANFSDFNVTVQSDELKVWSSEYRDIFTDENTMRAVPPGKTPPPIIAGDTYNAAAAFLPGDMNIIKVASSTTDTYQVVSESITATYSDEKAHFPLRQTFLPRTHWKFDMGSSVAPRYLYAEWLTGDAVTPNPPNTI